MHRPINCSNACSVRSSILLVILVLPAILASSQDTQADPFYLRIYQEGMSAYQSGKYQEAAQQLELAIFGIRQETTRVKGAVIICICHYYLNQIRECERFFPRIEEFINSRGLEALDLGEKEKIDISLIWNHFYPDEVLYRPKTKATSFVPTRRELEEAAARLERQIEAAPDDINTFYDLHRIYFQMNEPKKAKKTLEKMMDKNPAEIKGYHYIGILEFRTRNLKDAVKYFEKFLQQIDENSGQDNLLRSALAYLILSHNFKGDKEKALELAAGVHEMLTPTDISSLDLAQAEEMMLKAILEKVREPN